VSGAVQRRYTYGLQRISQTQFLNSAWTTSFYSYDGFGSVRQLTDSTGAATDTYDYDAWGNAVNVTGSTPNVYRYRGEQYDPDLNLYYLRARYFNPLTGRFLTRDPKESGLGRPKTLHKYLYASSDPVNRKDPSGRTTYEEYILPIVMIPGGSLAAGGITLKMIVVWSLTAAILAEYLEYGYGPEASPPPEHNPDEGEPGGAEPPASSSPPASGKPPKTPFSPYEPPGRD
jgi:RHS repeat-associated protein